MRSIIGNALAVCFLNTVLGLYLVACALDLYVSPGNVNGGEEQSFSSLLKAQNGVRDAISKGINEEDITVFVADGTY